MEQYRGVIQTFREYLPVTENTPVVTLLEGNTPLIRAINIPRELGLDAEIYFKYEGLNPTGSFKDRGMCMAVTKAVEDGSKVIMCASTGNTSASAAAYAARAGMKCIVLVEGGGIALGKLAQAMIQGAVVLEIEGNFDRALHLVREITEQYPITLVNSLNPMRIEGQKTASFEIVEQLGIAPDYHFLPVGNAGNITAYWKGYREYREHGKMTSLPKMMGWQAEGAAPIVRGERVDEPKTVATAIKIGNPASWSFAEAARDESGGVIDMVSDDEILKAYSKLSSREGIFVEPASAASLAGVIKMHERGFFSGGETIVCTLTGHGLKDPDRAVGYARPPIKVKADKDSVIGILDI
ncbi:MAG: threonine synthase [Candidatus Latescibacteria bacterium]|nr:threonine synthase [Candidatus Latescibacterota bacterium]